MSERVRRLTTILITDAVGFSTLANQDEEVALRAIRKDLDLFRESCERYGGQYLKETGDGALMAFDSAINALTCATEIQRSLYAYGSQKLLHRMGIHLGDVAVIGNDIAGDGVNIASRLEQAAPPGGICLSQIVHEVVAGKMELNAQPVPDLQLKGIARPIAAYIVPPIGSAPLPSKTELTAKRAAVWPKDRTIFIGGAICLAIAASIILAISMSGAGIPKGGPSAGKDGAMASAQSGQAVPSAEELSRADFGRETLVGILKPSPDLGHHLFVTFDPNDPHDGPGTIAEFDLLNKARAMVGVPYVWGGNTSRGIDCSHYVASVMSSVGVRLSPPVASIVRSDAGSPVSGNLRFGDVLFFLRIQAGGGNHCAIYIGKGRVIHAGPRTGVEECDLQKIANVLPVGIVRRFKLGTQPSQDPIGLTPEQQRQSESPAE